ncbi:recombinase family protein [Bradyrhizobium australiense]|uniref:Recombinase family protein n=1 Tax=Bradyrhizobium australiense TaxID=2721161 RepID=A0A7Y4LY92_9BRAD|nr:recombinase family protein [Bradyrhizobium australiense]NOJ43021.1 recombinase family protein [Bradyrhizobium australiense]
MANALVVHKDRLPRLQRGLRAAQYVRMSTDYQRYSIENQAAAIAAYAQLHQLSIVRTYRDEGESGLRIKNRSGLTKLLDDVQSGAADFGHILVYDVSRWGRFQDIDESAHYEFICKQVGIKVSYCAELFDNDGSLLSSIVKNIKRVMAAEYSRELSAKVQAGKLRFAKAGFLVGGTVGYGLQRLAVDKDARPKGILAEGQCKYLITDHVRVQPGPDHEKEIVKWIFQEYLRGKSQAEIGKALNLRDVPSKTGRPWTQPAIRDILRNEAYVGTLIYNRCTQKLGAKRTTNPRDIWIRSDGCVEPIVDQDVFLRARKRAEEYHVRISEEEMLVRLRKVLMKRGRLSAEIIDTTPGLPSNTTYINHFGSLRNTYRLIGYDNTKFWDDLKANQRWVSLNGANGMLLRDAFERSGARATFDASIECLRVNDDVNICFGVAKCRKWRGRLPLWTLRRRAKQPLGWTIAIRLGEKNEAILDYLLLPTPPLTRTWIWFSEKSLAARNIESFANFEAVARSLIRRVKKRRAAQQLNGSGRGRRAQGRSTRQAAPASRSVTAMGRRRK